MSNENVRLALKWGGAVSLTLFLMGQVLPAIWPHPEALTPAQSLYLLASIPAWGFIFYRLMSWLVGDDKK